MSKIVGWAEASVNVSADDERKDGVIDAEESSSLSAEDEGAPVGEEATSFQEEDTDEIAEEVMVDNSMSVVGEANNSNEEAVVLEDASETFDAVSESSPGRFEQQVIDAIKNAELYYKGRGSFGKSYDISSIDLRQIYFLIGHAERMEKLDYYGLVMEAFNAKRRLASCEYADCPDDLQSPHLDELIDFLERKYEDQFCEDVNE